MLKLIAAVGRDGAIGKDGDLIWHISDDLKHFKALTMGMPVIMGRKTWESLPRKPLPGRENIVLSRKKNFIAEGARTVGSVEEALELLADRDAFIIGGAKIYEAFLPYTWQLFLTLVDADCPEADSFLRIDPEKDWKKTDESEEFQSTDGISYRFVNYERQRNFS